MSIIQQNNTHGMNIPSDLQQRADQLHLAMHVHSNGMMAGLFDGQSKQPLWLSETFIATWELHNRIMEWGWNQPVFRKVTLSRSPLQWTLCPPYLLDPSNIGGWLHQSNENNVRAIPISGQNMILIEESESLYPMVHGLFPHLQEFSTVEFLLHYHLSTPVNHDRLLVVTEAEITRIFAHQQGKFLLANQYACKEPEDTLYFASAIVQQYELSNETPIILAGQNANIELIRLFEPYYTQVKAWTAPFGLKMPKGQVDAHWHSILLHTLCAS
jgi:Protein of unknown function (DUF3822)